MFYYTSAGGGTQGSFFRQGAGFFYVPVYPS